MPPSVPSAPDTTANLADVLPSCLVALGAADDTWLRSTGREARITLRPARSVVVVLVDGLGSSALSARAGHARWLTAATGGGHAQAAAQRVPHDDRRGPDHPDDRPVARDARRGRLQRVGARG